MCLIEKDEKMLHKCSLKSDINRLGLEFKKFLGEQNEQYLDYNKTEEQSIIEKILNK